MRRHGTPILIVRRDALRTQLARFRKALPRVEPFYAVKANPHPEIIKFMAAEKAGFDVASQAEMEAALAAGAPPARIIFANTIKPPEAIAAATKRGVDLMTFDSEYELDKLAEAAPGGQGQHVRRQPRLPPRPARNRGASRLRLVPSLHRL